VSSQDFGRSLRVSGLSRVAENRIHSRTWRSSVGGKRVSGGYKGSHACTLVQLVCGDQAESSSHSKSGEDRCMVNFSRCGLFRYFLSLEMDCNCRNALLTQLRLMVTVPSEFRKGKTIFTPQHCFTSGMLCHESLSLMVDQSTSSCYCFSAIGCEQRIYCSIFRRNSALNVGTLY